MVKIIIRTTSDLRNLAKKFEALSRTIPTIQKFAVEKAADEAVLTEIHREMEAQGISKKIIETTYVGEIEIIDGVVVRVHIISDYVAEDVGYGEFDVGEAREEGTDDHKIMPLPGNKTGKLWWIDPKTGNLRNSRGHWVSGLPRLLIVETTILKNQSKFADAYFENISSAYSQALRV